MRLSVVDVDVSVFISGIFNDVIKSGDKCHEWTNIIAGDVQ